MKKNTSRKVYSSFDVALISIIVSVNFVVSFYVAPILSLAIPHVFVGALIMVPFNLCLSYFVWIILQKRVFTFYFLLYGILTMPTTIWGSTPGLFKPLLGALIGLTLDILTSKLTSTRKETKLLIGFTFPFIWWSITGIIWQIAGLPIVQIFQNMLSSITILRPLIQQGVLITFTIISFINSINVSSSKDGK